MPGPDPSEPPSPFRPPGVWFAAAVVVAAALAVLAISQTAPRPAESSRHATGIGGPVIARHLGYGPGRG